jgi:hypothetical protein
LGAALSRSLGWVIDAARARILRAARETLRGRRDRRLLSMMATGSNQSYLRSPHPPSPSVLPVSPRDRAVNRIALLLILLLKLSLSSLAQRLRSHTYHSTTSDVRTRCRIQEKLLTLIVFRKKTTAECIIRNGDNEKCRDHDIGAQDRPSAMNSTQLLICLHSWFVKLN